MCFLSDPCSKNFPRLVLLLSYLRSVLLEIPEWGHIGYLLSVKSLRILRRKTKNDAEEVNVAVAFCLCSGI